MEGINPTPKHFNRLTINCVNNFVNNFDSGIVIALNNYLLSYQKSINNLKLKTRKHENNN